MLHFRWTLASFTKFRQLKKCGNISINFSYYLIMSSLSQNNYSSSESSIKWYAKASLQYNHATTTFCF